MPLNQELSYMKDAWAEFADIDLEQFYVNTMPDIVVEHCLFDSLDCRLGYGEIHNEELQYNFCRIVLLSLEDRRILIRHIWQVRKTKLGNCLAFDLHHEIIDGHFIHLSRIDLKSSEHNLGFDWVRTQGCGRRF